MKNIFKIISCILIGILSSFYVKVNASEIIVDSYMETPVHLNTYEGTNIEIRGWYLSNVKNVDVVLLIDEKEVEANIQREVRDDIFKSYRNKYSEEDNPTPGYKIQYDMSKYSDGEHRIRITLKNKDTGEEMKTQSKRIILKKYNVDSYMETPMHLSTYEGTTIEVKGWYLSNAKNVDVVLLIDEKEVEANIQREVRDDIFKSYRNKYSEEDNPTPGYKIQYDMSKYSDGEHRIRITLKNKDTGEEMKTQSKRIILKKYDVDSYMETPIHLITYEGTTIEVKGWYLSNAKNVDVVLLVDEKEVEANIQREVRDDIFKSYQGKYSKEDNPTPGYKIQYDMSKYNDGEHRVRITLKNKDTGEEMKTQSKRIILKKYDVDSYMETPTHLNTYKGTTIEVKGWYLSNAKNVDVVLLVDEKEVKANIQREVRDDIFKSYQGKYSKEDNPTPGYKIQYDMSKYSDGEHRIRITLKNKDLGEEIKTQSKRIILKKYDGKLQLEYPEKSNYNNGSNMTIQGWELSESKDSVVKVLIDNVPINVERYERNDVINSYQNAYNGIAFNPTPGYRANVDLKKFSSGEHILKVSLYSIYGDLLDSVNKKLWLYNHEYFGIDVSSHQGKINWDNVSKYGIDFTILRLGYGDNLSYQDDVQFLNNVNGAVNYNIPYGVYLYSYALKETGATGLNVGSESIDSEVEHTLRILKSLNSVQRKNLKLPVYIDMEDASTLFLGKGVLTKLADRFCNKIVSAGYQCGVYANRDWLTNKLDTISLEKKYQIWLAHYTYDYNVKSNYGGSYQIWQYSSQGQVSGIRGNVDTNISYKKYW